MIFGGLVRQEGRLCGWPKDVGSGRWRIHQCMRFCGHLSVTCFTHPLHPRTPYLLPSLRLPPPFSSFPPPPQTPPQCPTLPPPPSRGNPTPTPQLNGTSSSPPHTNPTSSPSGASKPRPWPRTPRTQSGPPSSNTRRKMTSWAWIMRGNFCRWG